MRKLKIGLDFDGVFTFNGAQKALAAKELYGVDIPPHKFKKEILLAENLLSAGQYRTVQREIYDNPGWLERTPPPDNLDYYVSQLIKAGHTLVIVTSRTDTPLALAKKYLQDQRLFLEIIGTGYGNSKAPALEGFDVFMDDDEDKLVPVIGTVPHLFLFSCGYNQDAVLPKRVTRINGWAHFASVVRDIANG